MRAIDDCMANARVGNGLPRKRRTPAGRRSIISSARVNRKSTGLTLALLLASTGIGFAAAENASPLIGESERVYTLASENSEVRGLAFDASPDTDGVGKVRYWRDTVSIQPGGND